MRAALGVSALAVGALLAPGAVPAQAAAPETRCTVDSPRPGLVTCLTTHVVQVEVETPSGVVVRGGHVRLVSETSTVGGQLLFDLVRRDHATTVEVDGEQRLLTLVARSTSTGATVVCETRDRVQVVRGQVRQFVAESECRPV